MPTNRIQAAVRRVLATAVGSSTVLLSAFGASAAIGAPADETSATIEEVIVTAQRVEQRLQDIPLSISVLSGDEIANANVTNIDRLEQLVPGLRVGRSGSDARPAMRGTYTENVAANGEPRFGIYIDDVYQSRTSQNPPLVDLARVEVQKGPQGTLYGRNSFGGNLAFHSAKPEDEFGAGIEALFGNYSRKRVEGFVNLPVTPSLSTRFAGVYEKADGYVKNSGTGSDLGDENQWYVRGMARFVPESLDGRLEVLGRASHWHQGGEGMGGFYFKQLGSLVDVPLIRPPGGSISVGGETYVFPGGFNGSSFSGTPTGIDTRYRDGVADINGADIGIPIDPDPYRVNFDGDWARNTRQDQVSLSIAYDTGPVTLRSITSYTDFSVLRTADDLTPAPLFIAHQKTEAKTVTQELQVLSSDQESRVRWIVGAYFFDDEVKEWGITEMNRNYSTAIALATGQFPLYNFGFNALPTVASHGIAQYRYDGFSAVLSETRSYAGYTQAEFDITDKLTVTAGYRYTSDRKEYAAPFFNVTATPPPGSTIPSGFYAHNLETPVNFACNQTTPAAAGSNATPTQIANAYIMRCGERKFNYSTYRLAADYELNDDQMVYASVSTGQHAGGFNGTLIPGTTQLFPFEPEKVLAYEIGSKNLLLDDRLQLNVALFSNEYTDLHAQTSIPNPVISGVLALVQNIGEDEAYGAEIEAIWKPTSRLRVNAALNVMRAREIDYKVNTFSFGFCGVVQGNCAGFPEATLGVQGTPFPNPASDPSRFLPLLDAAGNQVVVGGVPQYQYVVAGTARDGTRYKSRKSISPDLTAQLGIAYEFELGSLGTLTPEIQTYYNDGYILTDLTPDFGNQESYTKTDVRLTFVAADGKLTAQAYLQNLEDEAVINRVAYANNRSLAVFYAMPRTYGVTLGYRF